MTVRDVCKAVLLIWCTQGWCAEQPATAAVKQPDEKSTGPIADPTEGGAALKQRAPARSEAQAADGLDDPTRINENFRAALQHGGRAKAADGAADAAPPLPDIALVASVCGRHRENAAAMLKINDKTEIVHAGDRLTRIEKNQLIEIHIVEVNRRHVKVRVYPGNETLILR